MMDDASRYNRSADYLIRDQVGTITLAGCGSGGRHIALAIASMGIADRCRLYDPDTIEIANVNTQGWPDLACGLAKVTYLRDEMLLRSPDATIHAYQRRYSGQDPSPIVIIATDSRASRETIANGLASNGRRLPDLLLDGRQRPEGCRIVCLTPAQHPDTWLADYLATIPETDDRPENRCGHSPGTYYQGLISAGMILQRLAVHSRGEDPTCDIVYDPSDLHCIPLMALHPQVTPEFPPALVPQPE